MLALLASLAAAASVAASPVTSDTAGAVDGDVRISLNRGSFAPGEQVRVRIETSRQGHLVVFRVDGDGRERQGGGEQEANGAVEAEVADVVAQRHTNHLVEHVREARAAHRGQRRELAEPRALEDVIAEKGQNVPYGHDRRLGWCTQSKGRHHALDGSQ